MVYFGNRVDLQQESNKTCAFNSSVTPSVMFKIFKVGIYVSVRKRKSRIQLLVRVCIKCTKDY